MRQVHPCKWSTRTAKRFLFFPLTLPRADGKLETRWLESALIIQKYESANHRIGEACFWKDVKWYRKEESYYERPA